MTSIFRSLIPLFIESISFRHKDFLLKSTTLSEKYDDLGFDKKEVMASLQCVRDTIQNLDPNNILNELNNEFLGVGVIFMPYNNSYGSLGIGYPKEGIIGGDYDQQHRISYVYINDDFIEHFIDKKYDLLSNAIVSICTHENTHEQQIDHSNGKVKGLNPNVKINTRKGFQQYLELFSEIDAHAREVASYLYNTGNSGAKISQMINDNDPILKSVKAYNVYWEYFGIVTTFKDIRDIKEKDTLHRLQVWKRFLSRIVAYLINTNRYQFTIEKKDALKNLTGLENKLKSQI